jgi:DNA-binding NarL/FixJ family response regulator
MGVLFMAHQISTDQFGHHDGLRPAKPRPLIVFVGGGLSFSERVITVFKDEFQDFEFIRVADIKKVAVARKLHDDMRLVIFDADQMQTALDNPRLFADAVGPAKIIFSLTDAHEAAKFMTMLGDTPGFGNIGFLPLQVQMDVWISIMHLFLCGHNFLPRSIADALIGDTVQTNSKDESKALTAREWEVLRLVAEGTQNKIIAADLNLSVHTVKLHVHNVLKKIGVSNRTCAAGWYMQHNGANPAGMHGGA